MFFLNFKKIIFQLWKHVSFYTNFKHFKYKKVKSPVLTKFFCNKIQ